MDSGLEYRKTLPRDGYGFQYWKTSPRDGEWILVPEDSTGMDNGFYDWKTQHRDGWWMLILEDTTQGWIVDYNMEDTTQGWIVNSSTGGYRSGMDNGF